jgi:two-component system, chemotaxis family, protein-glutamate methylesterase/glutaminase
MGTRDLVVVGASAGGIEALKELVARLPADLPATVLVCVHLAPSADSVLPGILSRSGPLPAKRADHGEVYARGTIYVAPPDHHLLVLGERLRVINGPRVNGHRPAIDPMFRAAARQFGPRVIGVILSGVLDDGTAGMVSIKSHGGLVIVQSPSEAIHPAMPTNVIENVRVDHTASASTIGEIIAGATREEIDMGTFERRNASGTAEDDALTLEGTTDDVPPGPPSMFTCPECNGALWELSEDSVLRYRCHVGHAWGPETLLATNSEALEEAIWAAYRALRESAMLAKRLSDRALSQGLAAMADKYRLRHVEALQRAELIRNVLARGQLVSEEPRIADQGR